MLYMVRVVFRRFLNTNIKLSGLSLSRPVSYENVTALLGYNSTKTPVSTVKPVPSFPSL